MGWSRRHLAAILLLAALTGCGNEPAASPGPLTSRAIAAVMLDHLPDDTTRRGATYEDETTPPDMVGADFRYRGDTESDGDLVQVTVDRAPLQPCTNDGYQCAQLDDTTRLLWEEEEPEDDPGVIVVQHLNGDELVTALVSGPSITGDPRTTDVTPAVTVLADLTRDPRLRLDAGADVISAGETVDDWEGGEPNEAALAEVPNNDKTVVTGWIWAYADTFDYLGASPLKARLGSKSVAGRVRLGQDFDLLQGRVLDAFAGPTAPAWVKAPCNLMATSGMRGFNCADLRGTSAGLRLLWRPSTGEAFVVHAEGEGVVGFHTILGQLPVDAREAAGAAGAFMFGDDLTAEPDGSPRISLTTTRENFDAAMKRG